MRKVTKEEIKSLQLGIVAEIDRICRENAIDYSLAAGSLLGAVKYQGYIPWDDDIDIMLTRPNYEKLMQLLMQLVKPNETENKSASADEDATQETSEKASDQADGTRPSLTALPENLSLHYFKLTEAYLPFAKLYDNRTVPISHRDTLSRGVGVFVDIFPIDSLPDDQEKGRAFKREVHQAVTQLISSNPHGFSYASAEHWAYFLGKLILWGPTHLYYRGHYQELALKVDKLMQTYATTDSHFCNYIYNPRVKSGYFPKTMFETYEDTPFEQLTLRKIVSADGYLRELYGDYKQTPALNQQKNHDYYRFYWK